MTPLPAALNPAASKTGLSVWRLEVARHAATWHTGEGAFQVGGRWSPKGRRVIYCALEPSTAILEVAVHKSFEVLDTVAHKLLHIVISRPELVHQIDIASIPNKAWLQSGTVSAGQQAFGDALLKLHPFLLVPSVVSTRSWNLLIDVNGANGMFSLLEAEGFNLDTRLNAAR
ncbi:MAG: RES domain-containing protein [Polaromonas sp.]|nr:RES domain-containing protein [Polaromonas sp.]